MPLSNKEKLFGRIYGAALTIVGCILVYVSYTSIADLGNYWKFFFIFGVALAIMGLPILLLKFR